MLKENTDDKTNICKTHYKIPNYLHLSEKLKDLQGVKSRNSTHFIEPTGSLPHSQQPATSPYPEPDQSSLLFLTLLQEGPL
jgi:hypothetical protein